MFEGWIETAREVVLNIFETMCFIALEPLAPDRASVPSRRPPCALLRGEIVFQGETSGRLRLYVPSDLAKSMAVNFLGQEDEEISDAHLLDMVCELSNMVGGNLLSRLGRNMDYTLAPPQSRLLSPEEMTKDLRGSDRRVDLETEEGDRVTLHIEWGR
jgi:CheY-specific phosphatase CheX